MNPTTQPQPRPHIHPPARPHTHTRTPTPTLALTRSPTTHTFAHRHLCRRDLLGPKQAQLAHLQDALNVPLGAVVERVARVKETPFASHVHQRTGPCLPIFPRILDFQNLCVCVPAVREGNNLSCFSAFGKRISPSFSFVRRRETLSILFAQKHLNSNRRPTLRRIMLLPSSHPQS